MSEEKNKSYWEQQSVNLLKDIVPLSINLNQQADEQMLELERQDQVIDRIKQSNDKMDYHIDQSDSLLVKMRKRLQWFSCLR